MTGAMRITIVGIFMTFVFKESSCLQLSDFIAGKSHCDQIIISADKVNDPRVLDLKSSVLYSDAKELLNGFSHYLWMNTNCVIINAITAKTLNEDILKYVEKSLRHSNERIILLGNYTGFEIESLLNRWALDMYTIDGITQDLIGQKCAFMEGTFTPLENEEGCDKRPFYKQRKMEISVYHRFAPFFYLGERIGVEEEMLMDMSEKFNFDYNIIPVRSGYSDIIRKVINKTSDMAISQPSMTLHRQLNTALITPMDTRNLYIVTLRPASLPSYWTLFYPFAIETWIGVLVSTLAVTTFLILIEYMTGFGKFFHAMTIGMSTAINESLPHYYYTYNSNPKTLMFWTWILCGLILNLAYRSTLLANLVTIQYEKPINTAQDLLNSGLSVYAPKDTFIYRSVSNHPSPIFKELVNQGRLLTYERGQFSKDKVSHSNPAAMPGSESTITGYEDKLRKGTEMIASSFTTWAMAKGSPLREEFTVYTQLWMDSGLMRQRYRTEKFKDMKPKHFHQQRLHFEDPLNLQQCTPMMLICPLGLIPALIIFLCELLHKFCSRRKQHQNYPKIIVNGTLKYRHDEAQWFW